MTTIVAIRDINNQVVMACDTRMTMHGYMVANFEDKIVKVTDGFYVGSSGYASDTNVFLRLLLSGNHVDLLDSNKYGSRGDLLNSFCEQSLRPYFIDQNMLENGIRNTEYIVVLDKKMYMIDFEQCLIPVHDRYVATGSGSPFVLGYLQNHKVIKDANKIAKKCIECAMELDVFTGGKIKTFVCE